MNIKLTTRINQQYGFHYRTLVKGEQLVKCLIRKLRRFLLTNVNIVARYNNKKISFICTTKDKIPIDQKSNVIYEITCPGCDQKYIGKTDRCLGLRMDEQGRRNDQPMYNHLINCSKFKHCCNLFMLPDTNTSKTSVNVDSHILNAVKLNHRILDNNPSRLKWAQLSFLEAYYIKRTSPRINDGLKGSKELVLFN